MEGGDELAKAHLEQDLYEGSHSRRCFEVSDVGFDGTERTKLAI